MAFFLVVHATFPSFEKCNLCFLGSILFRFHCITILCRSKEEHKPVCKKNRHFFPSLVLAFVHWVNLANEKRIFAS